MNFRGELFALSSQNLKSTTNSDCSMIRYFAQEIIGNLMDLEPRQWRKPRRIDFRSNRERVDKFKVKYDKYDWTKALSG